jgi:hypothetical protein
VANTLKLLENGAVGFIERLCDKSGKKLTSCGRSGSKDEKGMFSFAERL